MFTERNISLAIRFIAASETSLAVSQPRAKIESFRKKTTVLDVPEEYDLRTEHVSG